MSPAAADGGLPGPDARIIKERNGMYEKPAIERFGTLRDLTRVGTNADCDGGIFGIGVDGSNIGEFFGYPCSRS